MVSLKEITFSYCRKISLFYNFDLEIVEGSIFCLVGPNGAGKTTLLKIISGMLNPKKGEVSLFTKNYHDDRNEIYRKIFVTIDLPVFYNNLSGYDNLKILCAYRNIDTGKIKYAMELFGLNDERKAYKIYSLGMKQKLNLAAGFLYNPKLIILDEPFNSLDPSTIIQLRNLIIKLNNEEGVTFVISSHLLREVGSFCTHYGIIDNGKLLDTGVLNGDINELENKFLSVIS